MPTTTKPLDISAKLGKVQNRIHRVGVELEGAWFQTPAGIEMHRDGSVSGMSSNDPNKKLILGEVHSEPREPITIPAWMRHAYPHRVNNTCGLHVHMSFKNAIHYQTLMDTKSYQDTILAELLKWATAKFGGPKDVATPHPIFKRLEGGNSYCKDEFYPDSQVKATSKNYNHDGNGTRYTIINYCWGLHETLECRVLPMFANVEEAIEAVQQVLDITNACLAVMKPQRKVIAHVQAHDVEPLMEHRREYV